MPSDSFDHRRTTTAKPHHTTTTTTPPPPEPEHLPCPRCDSTNTKFCYYNNYNFSQPRHFCKACRRYWTHGGTLRDIPVGGGSRKNAKRSRLTTTSNNNNNNHHNHNSIIISPSMEFRHVATAAPMLLPFSGEHGGGGGMHFFGDGGKGESFTSLLNCSGQGGGGGFFNLGFEDGNFGIGIGSGRGVWPFSGVGDCGGFTVAGGGGNGGWGVEGGEGGGECFTLPDLAISTPGMML